MAEPTVLVAITTYIKLLLQIRTINGEGLYDLSVPATLLLL